MQERKYYHAYDDRYRQIHDQNLQWFHQNPSPIVAQVLQDFSISQQQKLLEIGCGEGRDAIPLLKQGFNLLATDVSAEAISFCQKAVPSFAKHFQILDCIEDEPIETFDFIFAIAVLHMLVLDEDRNAFYRFLRKSLSPRGIALIGTMGDGTMERQSDISTAFDMQDRLHEQTGKTVQIASTSCRMVNFNTFQQELHQNGFTILRQGITSALPDFTQMMFAVIQAGT